MKKDLIKIIIAIILLCSLLFIKQIILAQDLYLCGDSICVYIEYDGKYWIRDVRGNILLESGDTVDYKSYMNIYTNEGRYSNSEYVLTEYGSTFSEIEVIDSTCISGDSLLTSLEAGEFQLKQKLIVEPSHDSLFSIECLLFLKNTGEYPLTCTLNVFLNIPQCSLCIINRGGEEINRSSLYGGWITFSGSSDSCSCCNINHYYTFNPEIGKHTQEILCRFNTSPNYVIVGDYSYMRTTSPEGIIWGHRITNWSILQEWEIDSLAPGEETEINFSYSKSNIDYDFIEYVKYPERINLKIFPNPFNSSCTILAPKGAGLGIFGLLGNVILEKQLTKGSFIWQPDESVGSGVYLVKATKSKQAMVSKILYIK